MRRFTTFVWGMAIFGIFGLMSVIAYMMIGSPKTAENLVSEQRLKVIKEAEATQQDLLAKNKVDLKLTPELKAKPKKTKMFVPGTPSHDKASASPVASSGLDGQKIFTAKGCATCHGPMGNKPLIPLYPVLSGVGKGATYLADKMRDIKSGKYTTALTPQMKPMIDQCNDEEIDAMSQWLSTVK